MKYLKAQSLFIGSAPPSASRRAHNFRSIDEFHVAQVRRATNFNAPIMGKGPSGWQKYLPIQRLQKNGCQATLEQLLPNWKLAKLKLFDLSDRA